MLNLPNTPSPEATIAIVDTRDCEEQDLSLTTVCTIKNIVAEPDTVAAENLFRVTVADAAGGEFTAQMTADELTTFDNFRAALLDRYGSEFDDCNFTGRRGHDRWQTAVYDLLGKELPA